MILYATSGSENEEWTVTRGAEGTTAASHTSGATITHVLTADALYAGMLPNGGSTGQILRKEEFSPNWVNNSIDIIGGANGNATIDAGPYDITFSGAGYPALTISSTNIEEIDYPIVSIPAAFVSIGDTSGTLDIGSSTVNIGYSGASISFYEGASSTVQEITAYTTTVSDPPTQAEVQAIHDKLEDLITALQAVGLVKEPI